MATVTVYRSTDANAPVLNGQDPSSFLALLTACLVTGYGSKPGAGWSAPYTASGITVFKTGTPSNGMYMRAAISTGLNSGNYGLTVTGGQTCSGTDINSLINPFPVTSQLSQQGVYWLSGVQSPPTTPAKWTLFADPAFMHIELQTNMTNGWYRQHYMFGDILPPTPDVADSTNTILIGCANNNQDPNYGWNYSSGTHHPYFDSDPRAGWYMASGYTQNTGSIPVGWVSNSFTNASSWARGSLSYPNPSDGGFYLSPVFVFDKGPSGSAYVNFRGTVPGLFVPCHDRPLNDGAIFAGTGPLNGQSFQAINSNTDITQDLRGVAVQTTNWR